MTASRGISTLLMRSMPFCTPNTTTRTVAAAKIRKKMSGCHGSVMKELKYAEVSTAAPPPSTSPAEPVKKATMYLTTQPPMTQ